MASDILDREALLDRIGGDVEFLGEIAELFREDTPRILAEIRTALTSGDGPALERAAHSLKGSVANLGGGAAREAAYRLEQLGRSGNLSPAPQAYATLEVEVSRFQRALSALSTELSR